MGFEKGNILGLKASNTNASSRRILQTANQLLPFAPEGVHKTFPYLSYNAPGGSNSPSISFIDEHAEEKKNDKKKLAKSTISGHFRPKGPFLYI
jgi:hypothetical protein